VHPKSSKNIQENPNPKNAMNKPKAKKKRHQADRIDEATFLRVSELWSSFLSPIVIFFLLSSFAGSGTNLFDPIQQRSSVVVGGSSVFLH
jgi:hypothetical protein